LSPKSHHSTWGCTKGEEALSPEKKTVVPLSSIHDSPSLLQKLQGPYLVFIHGPHLTPPGAQRFQHFHYFPTEDHGPLLPADTGCFEVFSITLIFPEMGA